MRRYRKRQKEIRLNGKPIKYCANPDCNKNISDKHIRTEYCSARCEKQIYRQRDYVRKYETNYQTLYEARPEVKERRAEYHKEYYKRPDVQARILVPPDKRSTRNMLEILPCANPKCPNTIPMHFGFNSKTCSWKCATIMRVSAHDRHRVQRPPWMHRKEINIVYRDCPLGMVVDHIVPLKGLTIDKYKVSGLHVPWNLQYLTPDENRRKWNRMRPEDMHIALISPMGAIVGQPPSQPPRPQEP